MPSTRKPQPHHTAAERQRVLDALASGDNWVAVALSNGISRSSAYRLAKSRRIFDRPRGGVRATCVKVTPAIEAALMEHAASHPRATLQSVRASIVESHGVALSLSTISLHLHRAVATSSSRY